MHDPHIRARSHFIQLYNARHPLRLVMAAILSATMGGGLITNWLLFQYDVDNIGVRYAAATVVGYLLFLLIVRLWLWSTVKARAQSNDKTVSDPSLSLIDGSEDIVLPSLSLRGPGYAGSGGKFAGAGSTGSWENSSSPSAAGSTAGSTFADGDSAVAVIAVVALITVFAGSSIYLIYSAPAILGECAFQVGFAGLLAKRAQSLHEAKWLYSILNSTWKPFSFMLSIAVIFGLFCHHVRPDARRAADLFEKQTTTIHRQNSMQDIGPQ